MVEFTVGPIRPIPPAVTRQPVGQRADAAAERVEGENPELEVGHGVVLAADEVVGGRARPLGLPARSAQAEHGPRGHLDIRTAAGLREPTVARLLEPQVTGAVGDPGRGRAGERERRDERREEPHAHAISVPRPRS